MSGSLSSFILASRPHCSDESSPLNEASRGGKKTKRDFSPNHPDQDHLELQFLRVVGKNKVPITVLDDIQLDCLDPKIDNAAQPSATMEVHRGCWKGQRVAVKYIRRSYAGKAYRRAMNDMNFELQLMSKSSLREHRNIPKLLAVCFDQETEDTNEETNESTTTVVHPGLVVELAHEQFPDLGQFFDRGCHPNLSTILPFGTSAKFIADIADGITVLHDHDIVHADLKPQNILLFPDSHSPGDLVAKIADFGFVGMTTYTGSGQRAGLPDARPRGGTAEWSAPECLDNPDPWVSSGSLEHPQYEFCSDIYSFGLLSCYIALDGQPPAQYVSNLSKAKLSGTMLNIAVARLREHYSQRSLDGSESLEQSAVYIAQQTLNLDWKDRIESLRSIRGKIFGTQVFHLPDHPTTMTDNNLKWPYDSTQNAR